MVGPKTPQQLDDNLAALDVTLPEDTVQRIDEASRPRLGYPHDFLLMARQMMRQMQVGAVRG